jgi:NAD dependent epimerase/dehydratase family enzyme
MKRIIIAGGSGFLGREVANYFAQLSWEVLILTRHPTSSQNNIREILWDAQTLGAWTKELDGAAVVVNLAGKSVNCRYHARNRDEI